MPSGSRLEQPCARGRVARPAIKVGIEPVLRLREQRESFVVKCFRPRVAIAFMRPGGYRHFSLRRTERGLRGEIHAPAA